MSDNKIKCLDYREAFKQLFAEDNKNGTVLGLTKDEWQEKTKKHKSLLEAAPKPYPVTTVSFSAPTKRNRKRRRKHDHT